MSAVALAMSWAALIRAIASGVRTLDRIAALEFRRTRFGHRSLQGLIHSTYIFFGDLTWDYTLIVWRLRTLTGTSSPRARDQELEHAEPGRRLRRA